jgi:RNA polymerase sigma-70 factor (ECF subfamily)
MTLNPTMKHTDPSTRSDEEIAGEALRTPDAFGILMKRYEAPLSRYIRRISSFSPDETEDVLQEAYVKAYRHLRNFDGKSKFSSWIYRIARNQTIDTARKRKTKATVSIEEHELGNFLRATTDLEGDLVRRDDLDQVEAAIRALPDTYRDALILRFLEEKSYEEIMDILHIPKGTVATLIRRGRALLMKNLKEKNGPSISSLTETL